MTQSPSFWLLKKVLKLQFQFYMADGQGGCPVINLRPQAISEEPQSIPMFSPASLKIARVLPATNRGSMLPFSFSEMAKNRPLNGLGLSFAFDEAGHCH